MNKINSIKVQRITGANPLDEPLKGEGSLNKGKWLVETIEKEVGINIEDKHEVIYYNLVRGLETLEYMTYKQIGHDIDGESGSYVEAAKRRNNPTANWGLQHGEETLLMYKNLLYGGLEDREKPRAILKVINRLKTFRECDLRHAGQLREKLYKTTDVLIRNAIMDDEAKQNITYLGDYYNYYTNTG